MFNFPWQSTLTFLCHHIGDSLDTTRICTPTNIQIAIKKSLHRYPNNPNRVVPGFLFKVKNQSHTVLHKQLEAVCTNCAPFDATPYKVTSAGQAMFFDFLLFKTVVLIYCKRRRVTNSRVFVLRLGKE